MMKSVQKAFVTMKRESDPKLWRWGFRAGWLVSFILIGFSTIAFFML